MQIDEPEGCCVQVRDDSGLDGRRDGGSRKQDYLRAGVCLTPHDNPWGSPGGPVVQNPPAIVGDAGSIPESGRSPGGGNGNPLQYSCLENPMDRGISRANSPWGRRESDTTERLSMHSSTLALGLLV